MAYNENNNFNRSGNYKKDRPKPYVRTLRITLRPSVNGGRDYTDKSAEMALIHLNEQILPYINVPIIMNRSTLLGDEEKRGTVNVGYIKAYNNDNDDHTFEVGFFNKNVEAIKKLDEDHDLHIAVNCIANDEQLTRFVSFELIVD